MTGRLRNLRPFWSRRGRRTAFVPGFAPGAPVLPLPDSRVELLTDPTDVRIAELEAEAAALKQELIAVAGRASEYRRMLNAAPNQAYQNCLDLSDRNAELRRQYSDLEKRFVDLAKAAAPYGVIA